MFARLLILLLIVLGHSCGNNRVSSNLSASNQNARNNLKLQRKNLAHQNVEDNSARVSQLDTSLVATAINEKPHNYKKQKVVVDQLGFTRYIQFPTDDNFNGKPMVHQLELEEKILNKSPDTLLKLAIETYQSFEQFFPKSIACNFEEGTSTESFWYPDKLIFRFEIFENEHAPKAYLTRDVTVTRNRNGELSAH